MANVDKGCEKPAFFFFLSEKSMKWAVVLFFFNRVKALWIHSRWWMSWYDFYFLKFVNFSVLEKSLLCTLSVFQSKCHVNRIVVVDKCRLKTHIFVLIFFCLFFLFLESGQWLKCYIKFWNATKCKSSKARKHRAFRTKNFITSAGAGMFHPNLDKVLLFFFHLVLCFGTKIFFS